MKWLSLKMETLSFNHKVYLGSYTRHRSKGIYSFDNDCVKLVVEVDNPTYLAQSEEYIYSVFGSDEGCGLLVVDKKQHTIVQKIFSDEKSGACHIIVDEDNDLVVTSNYHEHAFHVYRKFDNLWQPPIKVDTFNQDSKIHYSYFCKSTKTLYVTDLGLDKIYLYHLEDLNTPFKELLFPKGSGVRHCVFSSDEKRMFAVSEYSGEVFVFENDILISQVKTDPNHSFQEAGAAIRLTKDEKYLAVSLRTKNIVVIYEIEDGYLQEFQRLSTQGEHPRDFNFIDEQTMLIANRDTNDLTVYNRHLESDKFEFVKTIDAPEIVCVSVFEN